MYRICQEEAQSSDSFEKFSLPVYFVPSQETATAPQPPPSSTSSAQEITTPVAIETDEEVINDLQTALRTGGSNETGFAWSDQVDDTQLTKESTEVAQQEGDDAPEAHRLMDIIRTDPTDSFNVLQQTFDIQPSTAQERFTRQLAAVQQIDDAINNLQPEAVENEQGEAVPGAAVASNEGQASSSGAGPSNTV